MVNNATKYSLMLICLVSIIGSIIYYFYKLNWLGISFSVILAIGFFFYFISIEKQKNRPKKEARKIKLNLAGLALYLAYFFIWIATFYVLFANSSDFAITSPWEVVPAYFFVLYLLLTLVLLLNIFSGNTALILIIFYYFLSFSVAAVIYKIGYGFDPFIHNASLKAIDQAGAIFPKNIFYLGQYSQIIIIHKIIFIPINFLNKWLVPALGAVFLPLSLFILLKKWFDDNKKILLAILFLLIFPFSFFIVSIPQNLAYLFLILTIIFCLSFKTKKDFILIYLLALTSFFIQPIAGIPALIFVLIFSVYKSNLGHLKLALYVLLFLLSTFTLPFLFYFLQKQNIASNTAFAFNFQNLNIIPSLFIPSQENIILNFAYFYNNFIWVILTFFAVYGIILAFRYKEDCKVLPIFFFMFLTLLFSYLIARTISFDFLIDYERSDYPIRILYCAIFFLLPFILISFYDFTGKILSQNKFIKASLLIFFAILIVTSLYLSYPRKDNYYNSHGFSVSANDLKAAQWIYNDNQDDNYIVLANQQASVAALNEYGFKKYFDVNNEKIFYYPIPTGGKMYQYFLDMVYKNPSRENISKAMDLAGVGKGYFVLNKYWWASTKLVEEAKLEADSWHEIDNGEIYIFEYKK